MEIEPLIFSQKKFSQAFDIFDLQDAERKSRVQRFVEISYSLPFTDFANTKKALELVRRELKVEDDNDIKVLLISIMGRLAREPNVDASVIIEDLISQVTYVGIFLMFTKLSGKSRKVIAHTFQVLAMIGESKHGHNQRLIELACHCI
jgi:hypothetical protein